MPQLTICTSQRVAMWLLTLVLLQTALHPLWAQLPPLPPLPCDMVTFNVTMSDGMVLTSTLYVPKGEQLGVWHLHSYVQCRSKFSKPSSNYPP